MKNIILIVSCFIFALTGYAEKIKEANVPMAVKDKLQAIFPATKNIKWEKEFGNYEAEFDKNGNEISVLFAPDGQWLQTENVIKLNELPNAVMIYVEKKLSNKKIIESVKVVDAKNNVSYEIEVDGEEYLFDNKGNFLRKQKV